MGTGDGGTGVAGSVTTPGTGRSIEPCVTTVTRSPIARASTSQPSSLVVSTITGDAGAATSTTVTTTCQRVGEWIGIMAAVPMATSDWPHSCEITVNRVPARKSCRSSPGRARCEITPSRSGVATSSTSMPSPAIANRCDPSVFTRSPSSTPATCVGVWE